jgi:hypothetical protein
MLLKRLVALPVSKRQTQIEALYQVDYLALYDFVEHWSFRSTGISGSAAAISSA